jgi:hypothetical protein
MGNSLSSMKLSYLTPTMCSAWIFPIWITKTRIVITDTTSAINIYGKPARTNWLVRSQYAISAILYLNLSFSVLWYHYSPADALEQTLLPPWVVGDLYPGAFIWCLDSFGALAQMDLTLIGRMQHFPAGLASSHKHPKAQGSCPSSLVLYWGMDHIKI